MGTSSRNNIVTQNYLKGSAQHPEMDGVLWNTSHIKWMGSIDLGTQELTMQPEPRSDRVHERILQTRINNRNIEYSRSCTAHVSWHRNVCFNYRIQVNSKLVKSTFTVLIFAKILAVFRYMKWNFYSFISSHIQKWLYVSLLEHVITLTSSDYGPFFLQTLNSFWN